MRLSTLTQIWWLVLKIVSGIFVLYPLTGTGCCTVWHKNSASPRHVLDFNNGFAKKLGIDFAKKKMCSVGVH